MNKVKQYSALIGTGLTFLTMLILMIVGKIDWGTFLMSLPSLIVVYNALNKIVNPEEYESLEAKAIDSVKTKIIRTFDL